MARLEVPAPIDPSETPWPERENLSATTQPATGTSSVQEADGELADGAGHARDENGGHGPADRGRVIRPAGSARSSGPSSEPSAPGDDASRTRTSGEASDLDELAGPFPSVGPRDYELDEPRDNDLDDADDQYRPPPLPPQPKLDPVAKGAWIALFGGPGYLLLAMLLSWQIAAWAALTAVIAFVTGFVVLVIRLGDGPSKRDGPDQGAVV